MGWHGNGNGNRTALSCKQGVPPYPLSKGRSGALDNEHDNEERLKDCQDTLFHHDDSLFFWARSIARSQCGGHIVGLNRSRYRCRARYRSGTGNTLAIKEVRRDALPTSVACLD
jgi:hypothetical protein